MDRNQYYRDDSNLSSSSEPKSLARFAKLRNVLFAITRPNYDAFRPVTHQQIKLITVLSKEEQRRQLPNPSPFLTPILKLHSVLLAALRFQKDMAQGKVKGMKTTKQKATRPASSSSTTKKGKRYAAPKKADAIKIASLKRVRMRISPFPSLSTSPASFVAEGSVLGSVLNLVCAGPQRKDQSFDRATYRQRCFIWEAYDYEKRWFSR